ncbi:protein-disulfide reductase DsbD [uncultured Pseudomonas sp.]|uniref:protein-disulfide reductase DsbD n=1 Tax=uncultured Pseudomonas sp. TaxID=114707 RepID=UPI002615FA5A|nr:protein-disulfide reductase DsbD [uncultured Pseudomonas sp.]
MRAFLLFFLLWIGLLQPVQASSFSAKPVMLGSTQQVDFLPVEQAFTLNVEPQSNGETLLRWDIAPGYYLYQQRMQFSGLPADAAPELPAGLPYSDEFFGDSQIYREHLELTLPAGIDGSIQLGWQGCADAGLCYPPQTQQLDLSGAGGLSQPGTDLAQDQALAGGLQSQRLVLSLLLFFGLGLLLAFAPCSLPMLPILAGIVVGSGASPRRGLALASVYVVSMALVYAALGVVAALMGANLQGLLQQPWLLASFAALFVLLALPMFGLFELQLPAALRDRLESAGRKQQGGSLVGAGMLGVCSGLLVGPCMTAPLAAALLYIGQSGDALHGGLVLFVLGLGIGTPLLVLVTLGNRFLPKPGAWMNRVKVLFGFLFLLTALLVIRPLLAEPTWLGLWGALLILLASALLHLARQLRQHASVAKAIGALLGIWGLAMVLGAAGGASDPMQPLKVYAGSSVVSASNAQHFVGINEPAALERELAAAKAQGQWVLIDYYADWCVSCKVMEKTVFANPQVQASLQGVRLLRPDVTANNAASRALLARFQVLGPPTLLWLGPDGEERRSQRMTGAVNTEQFLQIWATTQERG